jgi:hypothetical protein
MCQVEIGNVLTSDFRLQFGVRRFMVRRRRCARQKAGDKVFVVTKRAASPSDDVS